MLNSRQQAFVEHYLEHGNATQAAIEAGYAEKSAHVTGARTLKSAKVIAEIERRRNAIAKRTDWSVEKLIESFEEIHNKATGLDLQRKLDEGEHVKMSDFVKSLDYGAAIRSLENIGKLIGAYVTKHEVEVKKPPPATVPTQAFPIDIRKLPSGDRVALLERFQGAVIEGECVAAD